MPAITIPVSLIGTFAVLLGSAIALRLRIERRSYCFEPEPRPPFDITGYRIEVEVGRTRVGTAGGPCW